MGEISFSSYKMSKSFDSEKPTFGELSHSLHVGRQVLGYQGDQSVVMLQLVDQVMAVKYMRTSLGLTKEKNRGKLI